MKKRAALLSLAVMMCATGAFAGSIDYLSNQSTDYIRMFSRNAATEGADIAMYNPAATAFVQDGLHLQYDHQTIFKTYTASYNDKDFKSDQPTWILPSLFGIYKTGNLAGYVTASAIAGGGKVKFDGGLPIHALVAEKLSTPYPNTKLVGGDMKAMSYYPELTVGGSYAINEMLSFSLGVRGIYAYKQYKGEGVFDIASSGTIKRAELYVTETAYGVGGVVGGEFRPIKDLALAARFETPVKLNFKTDVKDGQTGGISGIPGTDFFTDGEKHRKDLPAMMGLGASYVFFDRLTAIASLDTFFIGLSDQHTDSKKTGINIYDNGYDDDYDSIGYEASLGLEFAVVPNFLKLSCGYMYSKVGGNRYTYNDFDYALDSNSFGLGAKITPVENIDVALGASHTKYKTGKSYVESQTIGTTYKKHNYIMSASVECRIR